MREAYLALSTRMRQVIELRWIRGHSYEGIARELQVSVKSVDNYLARGMRLLRETLAGKRGH